MEVEELGMVVENLQVVLVALVVDNKVMVIKRLVTQQIKILATNLQMEQ